MLEDRYPLSPEAAGSSTAPSEPGVVRHLASKPGKAECIADWRAADQAVRPAFLTRRIYIRTAKTGRRYEKLWKNWHEFVAEASAAIDDVVQDSGAAPRQSADVPPPPPPTVAEPAAPEPTSESAARSALEFYGSADTDRPVEARYEVRDDVTGELICMAVDKPGLGDWIDVPPFTDGKFARAQVLGIDIANRTASVQRETGA